MAPPSMKEVVERRNAMRRMGLKPPEGPLFRGAGAGRAEQPELEPPRTEDFGAEVRRMMELWDQYSGKVAAPSQSQTHAGLEAPTPALPFAMDAELRQLGKRR